MNNNGNGTPFDMAFKKNCQLRPCAYDPSGNYETELDEQGSSRSFLRVSYKMLWFHTFCAEKNIAGYILCDDCELKPLGDYSLVTAKAKVIMDGTLVASAVAGQSFKNDDIRAMDGAVQTASSLAVSRALSNAGFGVISGFDASNPASNRAPFAYLAPEGQFPSCAGANGNAAGYAMPQYGAPASMVPASHYQPNLLNSPDAAASHQVQPDPIQAAKAVIWPLNGPGNGKTLGEILATSPGRIEWAATKWNGNGPLKDAAVALLPEALRLQGKKA